MTDTQFDIIAAFVDGEHVSPDALKTALADADARDYFVDLLSLREASRQLDAVAAPIKITRPVRPWLRLAGAAAGLTAAIGVGYVAGNRTTLARGAGDVPATAETIIDLSTPAPLPPATRVIKLQNGVNWSDQAKGR